MRRHILATCVLLLPAMLGPIVVADKAPAPVGRDCTGCEGDCCEGEKGCKCPAKCKRCYFSAGSNHEVNPDGSQGQAAAHRRLHAAPQGVRRPPQ